MLLKPLRAHISMVPYRLDITDRLHRRMLDIVSAALPLIPRSINDADLTGLAYLREEMVETLDAYCRHVQHLCEVADRSADPDQRTKAAALMAGCTDLRGAYDDFRLRWAGRQMDGHWHEYRLSTVVMMKRLRSTVERAVAGTSLLTA